MKKLTAALLAMSMTAGLLAGCGAPEPEETKAAAETAETSAEAGEDSSEAAEAVNPEDYKVGLMIPGNLGDKSFFDAAFNSIEPIKEQLGVTVEYVECGTDTSKFYPALVDMCEAGYDLILTISSNNDDALLAVVPSTRTCTTCAPPRRCWMLYAAACDRLSTTAPRAR